MSALLLLRNPDETEVRLLNLELESLSDLLRPLRDRVLIERALKHFVQRSSFDWFC